jgi:hypothetical protein
MSRNLRLSLALASLLPLIGCGNGTSSKDGGVLDLRMGGKDGPTGDMTMGKTDGGMADMTMAKTDGGGMMDMTMAKTDATMTMMDAAMMMPDLAMPDIAMMAPDLATNNDLAGLDLTSTNDMVVPPDMAMVAMPTFYVLRSGAGQVAIDATATAAFLEQYKLDGTPVGNPIALPTVAANGNNACTISGQATSEGQLTLSGDGHYLSFGCYNAATMTANISKSAVAMVARVAGRMDAAGNIDTTTTITDAFDANNIRGVTTQDGSYFWATGANSGIRYVQHGMATSVGINAMPTNTRVPQIYAGQLYASSGSGAFVNVFTVGTGLPNMANQACTSLPGLPVANASPYSFVLFDLDKNVAGVDTLYIADDSTIAKGGGIQKWTFDGQTWKTATFNTGLMIGTRGLAGVLINNVPTLIATTAEASPPSNTVVIIPDDGNSMAKVLVTSPMNTQYRGIAFAPN